VVGRLILVLGKKPILVVVRKLILVGKLILVVPEKTLPKDASSAAIAARVLIPNESYHFI
jgi:hypothetical protein